MMISASSIGQDLLNKNITVQINRQRLDQSLEIISNKGNFFFSYNSNIIRADSLISITANNISIRELLTRIFGNEYEFRESGNYIILRKAPIRIKLVTSSAVTEDKYYVVSGYVVDDQTGLRISDASVYEKNRLSIVNTNALGYFRLKLKSKFKQASITVSKEFYEDTTVTIETKLNQVLTITLIPSEINEHTTIIGPAGYEAPETINLEIPISDTTKWIYRYQKKDSFIVEKTALGKWLLSSKQKIQSVNLSRFFVARPYQVSLTPGLSNNGKLNGQVINNFSLNILGGYSGGTNGVEIGGLFNIDKRDMKYVQTGGIFNLVGGSVTGFQAGGVSNTVLDSVTGFQVAGVANYSRRKMSGMQTAGVYNHSGADLDGAQVAGVINFVNHGTKGLQVAGVGNVSSREVKGVQIAGVFNYTRRLKGVQIGLINIADTSSGFSIGLVNIVFKGYHKLSLYTNEVLDANASIKSGNKNLYSIFIGGYNTRPNEKLWSYGYGLGSELISSKRFSLNLELTAQQLHRGSWDHYNILSRANVLFNLKFGRYFSVFAAPAYNVYVSNQDFNIPGYKTAIPSGRYKQHDLGNDVTGWIGWSAGIMIL